MLMYEEHGTRLTTFGKEQTEVILGRLIGKRARNNGAARHLMNQLTLRGSCRYDFPVIWGTHAVYAERVEHALYRIHIMSIAPRLLVDRLNRRASMREAILRTREIRAERRRLRALGLLLEQPRVSPPQPIAGANGRLKRHFQNTRITFTDACAVIAYAARLDVARVRDKLLGPFNEQGVATLRLPGGFVFRLDRVDSGERLQLVGVSAIVQLSTTNDNTHGAYRRLRKALRNRCHQERKEQYERAQLYHQFRKDRASFRRLAA